MTVDSINLHRTVLRSVAAGGAAVAAAPADTLAAGVPPPPTIYGRPTNPTSELEKQLKTYLYDMPNGEQPYDFGAGQNTCDIRSAAPAPMTDDVRRHEELRAIVEGSQSQFYDAVAQDPARNKRDALVIERRVLEPQQQAEFRHLLGVIGNPWTSLGVLHEFEAVPAAARPEVTERFLLVLRSGRDNARKTLEVHGVFGQVPPVYSGNGWTMGWGSENMVTGEYSKNLVAQHAVRQAGEAFEPFMTAMSETWNQMFDVVMRFPHDDASDANEYMRAGLRLLQARLPAEPVARPMERLTGFMSTASEQHVPFTQAARIYGLMLDQPADLQRVAGRKLAYDEAAAWLQHETDHQLPRLGSARAASGDVLAIALHEAPDAAALDAAIDRYARIYTCTGDAATLQKMTPDIERDLADGRMRGTRDELVSRLENNIVTLAALGVPREQVAARAVQDLRRSFGPAGQQPQVERQDDSVVIGGIKVPRRRPDRMSYEAIERLSRSFSTATR